MYGLQSAEILTRLWRRKQQARKRTEKMAKKAEDHRKRINPLGFLKTQKTHWVFQKAKKAKDKVKVMDKDKDKDMDKAMALTRARARTSPPS